MCPYCKSENVRRSEQGALRDTYFCLNAECRRSYTRFSPHAKRKALFFVAGTILTGGIGGIAATFLDDVISGVDDLMS